jgi:tRNA (adenine-N(1)-)-methyltransferase non-catalytic subunit
MSDRNHEQVAQDESPHDEITPSSVTSPGADTTSEYMNSSEVDPLLQLPSNVIREGDYMILIFADGKQMFAQALRSWRGKAPPVKINKRSYPTFNLIGLPYGTVLELSPSKLIPLPDGEDVIPEFPVGLGTDDDPIEASGESGGFSSLEDDEATADDSTFPSIIESTSMTTDPVPKLNDNRNLVDDNKSQGLHESEIHKMIKLGTHGSTIVNKLIQNSSTFDQKTEFSKAKYVTKKQKKYQPRCRIVRCTPYSVCEAVFRNRPRQLLNMREDTLGQILSYSNVSAGCQVLVYEQCMGVVTGALAQRMGGYGKILSIYSGQQPSFVEIIGRYNLTFAESNSIKWVHSGDVFGENDNMTSISETTDPEKEERDALVWPCPLMDHTRKYLETIESDSGKKSFLEKRCSRFARKLTRHTPMESKEWLQTRKCDSIVLAVRFDPTATLLGVFQYLAPSSPFVVFCEFIEPLSECFRELQKRDLAINLRLSDTWMREYQVLPGRTHPSMHMTQSGGFILTGIKLCPETGHNELDEDLVKELRVQLGGRRGRKKPKVEIEDTKSVRKNAKTSNGSTDTINTEKLSGSKRSRSKASVSNDRPTAKSKSDTN